MTLPLPKNYAAMEARSVAEIPTADGWLYEPKWDGFRCLAFKDDGDIELMSKSGKPLTRYFPDVVATLMSIRAPRFVLDGEIVVALGGTLSFDALLQRIHPAASRVTKLATEHPASLIVFDLLVSERGTPLVDRPLSERHERLDAFATRFFSKGSGIMLSPATTEISVVREWLRTVGAGMDGVIAKRLDAPYATGERTAMHKIKLMRTADCVVGGFRYAEKGGVVGSLLLGLYDDDGLLNHVGFMSSFKTAERPALTARLERLIGGAGFTGRAPGGPSRWSTERSAEWKPLKPELVVEVQYDHFDGGRFRHGTKLMRWRPDKAPAQCGLQQVMGGARVAHGIPVHGV